MPTMEPTAKFASTIDDPSNGSNATEKVVFAEGSFTSKETSYIAFKAAYDCIERMCFKIAGSTSGFSSEAAELTTPLVRRASNMIASVFKSTSS